MSVLRVWMGRDSSVGIATGYELDGPGIESRWGRNFQHTSRPALGPTQPPIQWVPCHSRGVKRPERGVDHPPQSSAEVKETVELYLYSPSEPSWPVVGWTLPLPLSYEMFFQSCCKMWICRLGLIFGACLTALHHIFFLQLGNAWTACFRNNA